MPNAKGKRTVGAEVDQALVDQLDGRAKAERRSRSEVIVRALRFFLRHSEVERSDQQIPKVKGTIQ